MRQCQETCCDLKVGLRKASHHSDCQLNNLHETVRKIYSCFQKVPKKNYEKVFAVQKNSYKNLSNLIMFKTLLLYKK